jgi:hypothetical protein
VDKLARFKNSQISITTKDHLLIPAFGEQVPEITDELHPEHHLDPQHLDNQDQLENLLEKIQNHFHR